MLCMQTPKGKGKAIIIIPSVRQDRGAREEERKEDRGDACCVGGTPSHTPFPPGERGEGRWKDIR